MSLPFLLFRGRDIVEDSGPGLPVANLSLSTAAITEGQTVTATVTLTNAAPVGGATVAFALTGSTTAYVSSATSGTISIAAGATTGTTVITTSDDSISEPNGTVTVTISSPSGCTLGNTTAGFSISDNDGLPIANLSLSPTSVTEGTSMTATVTLTMAAPAGGSTVAYTITGAATDDISTALTGTITIGVGQTTGTLTIGTIGDLVVEANDTYTITISSPTNCVIGTSTATGTIISDDAGSILANLSLSPTTIAEGAMATATVTLAGGSAPTRSGTAQAGSSTTITLDAGASGTNDFYVGAQVSITGGTGAGQSRTVTAYNGTTKVATVSPWNTVPNATSVFTVAGATVDWTITGAATGLISTGLTGTLFIAGGQTSAALSLGTLDNLVSGSTGTVTITISNPRGCSLGATTTATLTITDDEAVSSTVFAVSTYGAQGDGVTDDTNAIRAALAAAIASASTDVTVEFGTGTYLACRQSADAAWPVWPVIFNVAASNKRIRIKGAGEGATTLSLLMPGLLSPDTNWVNTGDSYVKVARFTGFDVSGTNLALDVSGILISGNCAYTGNHGVGGNTTTGDGWDITHKCFRVTSGTNIAVNVRSATLRDWKGEILWGGNHNSVVTLQSAKFYGSNASALSVTACVVKDSIIGGPSLDLVYNGVENFAFHGETTIVTGTTIQAFANGIVPIGQRYSQARISGNTFTANSAILASDGLWNAIIENNAFVSCPNGIINSNLGLYPGQTQGFGSWIVRGNIQSGSLSGALLINGQGQTIQGNGLACQNNTIQVGALLGGSFGVTEPFTADGTIINGGKDVISHSGKAALWTNTQRLSSPVTATMGVKIDVFGGASTGTFFSRTDAVLLSDNQTTGPLVLSLNNIADIPEGQIVTLTRGNSKTNWVLGAGSWNNFTSDLPVNAGPVQLVKQGGLLRTPVTASVSFVASSVVEGGNLVATVTLANGVGPASVAYTLSGPGAADVNTGSTPLTGTINIASGQTTGTLTIATVDDSEDEIDGTVLITLSSPVNCILSAAFQATAVIADNDTGGSFAGQSFSLGTGVFSTEDSFTTGHYWIRPYDFRNDFGAVGVAVSDAIGGGQRYLWTLSADHYGGADDPGQSGGLWMGWSNDPAIIPTKWRNFMRHIQQIPGRLGVFFQMETPWLVYDPDAGNIRLYAHGVTISDPSTGQETCLFLTSDMVTFNVVGVSHPCADHSGYQCVFRTDANNWYGFGLGVTAGISGYSPHRWESTDGGITFDEVHRINRTIGTRSFEMLQGNEPLNLSGLGLYALTRDDDRAANNGMAFTLVPIETDGDYDNTRPIIPVTPRYDGIYPGLGYIQQISGYLESGVYIAQGVHGFASDTGLSGTPELITKFQNVNQWAVIVDPVAAAAAAPFGVRTSCAAGILTVTWHDILPGGSYRIDTSTSATGPWTDRGLVTGGSATVNLGNLGALNYVRFTKRNAGADAGSRIVPQWISSASATANKHMTRVAVDGGDTSTVDMAWLDTVITWLATNGATANLRQWTDARFGVKTSGGNLKAYDLGATLKSPSMDFQALTSGITRSPNVFGTGKAGLVAAASSDAWTWSSPNGIMNNVRRLPQQNRWTACTVAAAYSRTGTNKFALWTNGSDGDWLDISHDAGANSGATMHFKKNGTGAYDINVNLDYTTEPANQTLVGVFTSAGAAKIRGNGVWSAETTIPATTWLAGNVGENGENPQYATMGGGVQNQKYNTGTGAYVNSTPLSGGEIMTIAVFDAALSDTAVVSLETLLDGQMD